MAYDQAVNLIAVCDKKNNRKEGRVVKQIPLDAIFNMIARVRDALVFIGCQCLKFLQI